MKLQTTMYVHFCRGEYVLRLCDMGEYEHMGVCVGTVKAEVDFTPPTQAEITAKQVAALREQIASTQAEAQVKANALQYQIDKLVAIECDPRLEEKRELARAEAPDYFGDRHA